ncbi:sigma-54 interaction domain-containing protein [Desulfoluna butyratoxydans]|uniref:sigma-54 interaction domain-containing protein n=1 Tax=Desulfoluna butyratoxydans TaxID=231438 RepID=UPI0031B57551
MIHRSLIPKPEEAGISLLNNLPEKPTTVILHESDTPEAYAGLVAQGADVVLHADVGLDKLLEAIEGVLESRRQLNRGDQLDRRGRIRPVITDFTSANHEMRLFVDEVLQVASSDSLLLILGETGVGKEHLARAIHAESLRSSGPFVSVNTAALPDNLLESELFGHEQGAFTGAVRARRGAFELAHGGTIFLDEIGEMPLQLQAKLLRVLQDFEIVPLGGERPIWVDVRVIAATNRDLEEAVREGHFRKDLYYRLSVVSLTIPPLRRRREDIPGLVIKFMDILRKRVGRDIRGVSGGALDALCQYGWPGNVRELMNVLERGMLLCRTGMIELEDLPMTLRSVVTSGAFFGEEGAIPASWEGKTLGEVKQEVLEQVERLYLSAALKKTRGRVGEAATLAGVHPRGLYGTMKRLGLKKEAFKKV